MTNAQERKAIDRLMQQASEALVKTDYFAAERHALAALEKAHAAHDYERLSRIVMPLQEARRQKRLAAADTAKLIRLSETLPDDEQLEPACYLIEPMLVGAHGRNLRDQADRLEIPVLVVVREPRNKDGLWPIVMIGPTTVRTRIKPPEDEAPTIDWMLAASEALGDAAFKQVDPDDDATSRVADLIELLGTCKEHELLHQHLADAALEAAREAAAAAPKPAAQAATDTAEADAG